MDVRIINPGRGYISYHDFVDLGNDSNGNLDDANLDAWLNEGNYTYLQFPIITVSGGGGNGATLKPILDENGSVVDVNNTNGGQGYFNINRFNSPKAIHTTSLNADEKNATLSDA